VILGEGLAVCLLLSAHRAVIFAIGQLSCIHLASPFVLLQRVKLGTSNLAQAFDITSPSI